MCDVVPKAGETDRLPQTDAGSTEPASSVDGHATCYLPEYVRGKRVILATEQDGKFMIDNSQLNSDMPGLAYRRSTSFDDRLDGVADGVATYGSVREGQLVDGWMKLVQIPMVEFPMPLSIIVFGATGDLAKKKLFPALYQLMFGCPDAPLLPVSTRIIGYGRSSVELGAFLEKQCANVQGQHRDEFLKAISYFQGGYSDESDFARLNSFLQASEGGHGGNRLFFLSVPPTVFGCVCEKIHQRARASKGFTRLIIEKPFGRDSQSFQELNDTTLRCFEEEQLFRIDHYLAKENVLNLVAFRFANQLYEPLWDRHHIAQVQIIWKEDLSTDGRGGYFDEFGIIRDMMQNHLLQVFMWLAMEPPTRLDAESIVAAKCRLLRATRTLEMGDCLLGQFTGNTWTAANGVTRSEAGYLDDKTVPVGSRCPTFAAAVLSVDNERWRGVPFFMRAGKGLDESMAEVRVMFKRQAYNDLVPSQPNELVIRIQPNAAIYLNCIVKRPGWSQDQVAPVNLDMTYSRTFPGSYVADAYERMLLQAAKGEKALFVSGDELAEAWRIFTPLLDTIDRERPQPVLYPFGSDAPEGLSDFAQARGVSLDAADVGPRLLDNVDGSIRRPHVDARDGGYSSSSPLRTPDKRSAAAQEATSSTKLARQEREATPPRQWRKLKAHASM